MEEDQEQTQEEIDKELDDFGRLRFKNNKGKRSWFMAKKPEPSKDTSV